MDNTVKQLTKDELYGIMYGMSYNVDGSVVKTTEKVRNYALEVVDGKTHIELFSKPVQIFVDNDWVSIEEVVSEEDKGLLYEMFDEVHLTGTVILDTDMPDGISVRSRGRVRNLKEQYEQSGINLPREFAWVDGASETSGVIILPKDDYDTVYIATDPDKDGVPKIVFIEDKVTAGEVRPYYEKKDGKTFIYVDHFSGGGGTQSSPYIISTEAELNDVRLNLGAYYIQDRDIVLSSYQTGQGWEPIHNFSGYYDGRGFSIKDLYINRSQTFTGLFGQQTGGIIKRVVLANVNIVGNGSQVGALVARADGNVWDCAVISGTVKNEGSAARYTGGLIGYQNGESTVRCYSHVDVFSDGEDVGGLMGQNYSGVIAQCFSTGLVKDTSIAQNLTRIGGFLGTGNCDDDNFYDMDKSGYTTTSGAAQGRTTAELKDKTVFISKGWDFWNYWHLADYRVNEGYPENRKFIKYAKGKGTSAEPFQIYNQFDLEQVRHFLYAYFRLETDLVLDYPHTGVGWLPIGHEGTENGWSDQAFHGEFDGNHKVIGNLYINRPSESYCGLFRYMSQGVIKNLELIDVSITAGNRSGALVGLINSDASGNGQIVGCKVTEFDNFKLDLKAVGGGLVGYLNSYAEVRGCEFNGTLTMNSEYAGGLVGFMHNYSKIYGSATRGEWVQYGGHFGGLVGEINASCKGVLFQDCVSAADMATQCSNSGGVFAYNYASSSYSDTEMKRIIVVAKTTKNAVHSHVAEYYSRTYYHRCNRSEVYYDRQRSPGTIRSEYSFTAKYTPEIRHSGTYTDASWNFTDLWFFDVDYDGDPNLLRFKLPKLPILGFRNKVGKYYTDEQGNILRYLDYGTLVAGMTSKSFPVWLQNNADFPVQNMQTWVDGGTVKAGIDVELSLTDNPFVSLDHITFGGTIPVGDAEKFFVRFKSDVTVTEGGTFDLRAKASPA